jgi:PhzF family phenazine biosynthesis protein
LTEKQDGSGNKLAEVILVDVFTCNGTGGNPCPVVVNAEGMSDREMQDIAAHYGHESGFVFPSTDGAHDFQFRVFVPNHEMEMCGHATIGALALLAMKGRLPSESVRLTTLSGSISGFVGRTSEPLP